MLVTITTDASYYHEHKQGGYAFWITSNQGRLRLAQAFKNKVHSSHDAEFKCIINALHYLSRHDWNVTQIYINTDSQAVIDLIENRAKIIPDYSLNNLQQYNAIIKLMNISHVSFRHVKGHKHTRTARHWVNSWCDKNAKAAAKKKIFGS